MNQGKYIVVEVQIRVNLASFFPEVDKYFLHQILGNILVFHQTKCEMKQFLAVFMVDGIKCFSISFYVSFQYFLVFRHLVQGDAVLLLCDVIYDVGKLVLFSISCV